MGGVNTGNLSKPGIDVVRALAVIRVSAELASGP
jgi:hypothetical protein